MLTNSQKTIKITHKNENPSQEQRRRRRREHKAAKRNKWIESTEKNPRARYIYILMWKDDFNPET